jgi:apolipoprotein D and lipocalin family protein
MKKFLLALTLLVALAGCNTAARRDPLPSAGTIDLDRFLGEWYVIASVPTILDHQPYNGVEVYERADRGIQVTYTFNSSSPTGDLKTVNARAMIDNPGINTHWTFYYTWPIAEDYRVLYLEPDYSVAVFGKTDRTKARILARERQIDRALYSDIILHLQDLGYNVGKIRIIPQQ